MNAVTLKAARMHLGELIEQVNEDAEPTWIITDSGKKAILVPEEEYNSWQETIYLLSFPANAQHIRKSIEEASQGRLVEWKVSEP